MIARASRGFTLIEAVVAGGLFVVLGLLLFALLKYGMLAHNRGLIGTDAQKSARELINRMTSDLQGGMVLQIPVATDRPQIVSSVLDPAVNLYSVDNDLAFTAPAKQNVTSLDTSQTASYVLVRYARGQTAKNKIYRRCYPYTSVNNSTNAYDYNSTTQTWTLLTSTFDTAFGLPGNNLGLTGTDTGWQEVVSLGGAYDLVKFNVTHRNPNASLPANQAPYDPNHYIITVSVIRYVQTPRNTTTDVPDLGTAADTTDAQNDRLRKDLTTEITLQRFQ